MSGEGSPVSVISLDEAVSVEDGCKATDETGAVCGETASLGILEQFQRMYSDRLKKFAGNDELAIRTLKSWVQDLTEQNMMLVRTVEALEQELLKRVDMMHEQLQKTNVIIKNKGLLAKREKNAVEVGLRHQVQLLHTDVSILLDAINKAKHQGYWSFHDLKLNTVNCQQLRGLSNSSRAIPTDSSHFSSQGDKEITCHVSTQTEMGNLSSSYWRKEDKCVPQIPCISKNHYLQYSLSDVHYHTVNNRNLNSSFYVKEKQDGQDTKSFAKFGNTIPQECFHKTLDTASEGNFETSFSVPLEQDTGNFYVCAVPPHDGTMVQNLNENKSNAYKDQMNWPISMLVGKKQGREQGDILCKPCPKSSSILSGEDFMAVSVSASSPPTTLTAIRPPFPMIDIGKSVNETEHSSRQVTTKKLSDIKKVLHSQASENRCQNPVSTANPSLISPSIESYPDNITGVFSTCDEKLSDSSATSKQSCCKVENLPDVAWRSDKMRRKLLHFSDSFVSENHRSMSPPSHINSLNSLPPVPTVEPTFDKTAHSHEITLSSDDCDSIKSIQVQSSTKALMSLSSTSLSHFPPPVIKECLSTQPLLHEAVASGSQDDLKAEVETLKSQLAERDGDINNYLERIQEMHGILTLSSQQVTMAVQSKQNSLREMARGNKCSNKVIVPQSSSIVPSCKAKVHTQTTADPSVVLLNQELDITRQSLGNATKQIKQLTAHVQESEKISHETLAAMHIEVDTKQEQMQALQTKVQLLEAELTQVSTQNNLKDEILHQFRKDLKIARNKLTYKSGADADCKIGRSEFSGIPEAITVCDSGVDDGEISVSSRGSYVDVNQLYLKISQQDEELSLQKEKFLKLEREFEAQKKCPAKSTPPKPSLITLRELEEYRLCTVEAQAAVEDLKDEIEAITSDIKLQEEKMEKFKRSVVASEDILSCAQMALVKALNSNQSAGPQLFDNVQRAVAEAKSCIQDIREKAEDYVRDRGRGEQRRASRERKVDKLQEQLDCAHDNMRDGIEAMEQVLAERYEADRLSQREFSDGSSYHSCRDSDSSTCIKQVDRLEQQNADLLNTLAKVENQKRDMEVKAAQYLRELERMRDQIGRRDFTEEMLHTKEQTVRELQGTLESSRRQMRELQAELERTARERDGFKQFSDQSGSCSPLLIAELQSELARVRNQLTTAAGKQALLEQYERRFQETTEQTEKLSTQLNTLTLNLQAKDKMLANKEETVSILQDTLDRTREELKLLKEKGDCSPATAKAAQGATSDADAGVSDEQQGQLVREMRLDLSEMLAQYRDCFTEVSRQTRWYRDLREAYQDLRAHAEHIKREALLAVTTTQKELETIKTRVQTQNIQIEQLKEQVWAGEQGQRRAEYEVDGLLQRLAADASQIDALKQLVDSLQTQVKEAKAHPGFSDEQEELRQLREFRDKCERAARSLADIQQQDKDCWGGLSWCESTESEDSQQREARLQATLGLLLVEAGRRRAVGCRDQSVKDSDSDSTDRGTKSPDQSKQGSTIEQDSQRVIGPGLLGLSAGQMDTTKCRVHGPAATDVARATSRYQRESAERRRRMEQERKNRALRNVVRCEACRDIVQSPAAPESDARTLRSRKIAAPCACKRTDSARGTGTTDTGNTRGRTSGTRFPRKAPPPQFGPSLLPPRPLTLPHGPSPPESSAKGAHPDESVSLDAGASNPESNGNPKLDTDDSDTISEATTSSGSNNPTTMRQLFVAPKLLARLQQQELEAQVDVLQSQVEELQAELHGLRSCASLSARAVDQLDQAVVTTEVPVVESDTQTDREGAESLVQQSEVRELAEEAQRQLREAGERRLRRLEAELEERQEQVGALREEVEEARGRALRALCGAELEAQLRDKDLDRLRHRFFSQLRGNGGEARRWRQYARRLERYCTHALWSPEGQLQGALEDNRQLREQLCQLRRQNTALSSQLQVQCEQSARCLAQFSSALEDDADSLAGSLEPTSPRRGGAALSARSQPLYTPSADKHVLREPTRAPHRGTLAPSRASSGSRESDPCDSGCWSLQASPPRASSLSALPPGTSPSSPARLCWLARPESPGPGAVTQTPSGATAFILHAQRPRGPSARNT